MRCNHPLSLRSFGRAHDLRPELPNANSASDRFRIVVWKKGVVLFEYSKGYRAMADCFRLKRMGGKKPESRFHETFDPKVRTEFTTRMQFLLNLPAGISFLIVSVVTTAAALAGLRFVRAKYSTEMLKENHEVAAIIFNAFGL